MRNTGQGSLLCKHCGSPTFFNDWNLYMKFLISKREWKKHTLLTLTSLFAVFWLAYAWYILNLSLTEFALAHNAFWSILTGFGIITAIWAILFSISLFIWTMIKTFEK